jgi:hypothetical protein
VNGRSLPLLEIFLVLLCVVAFVFLGAIQYRRQQAALPRVSTYSSFDTAGGGYAAWYELLQREGVRVGRYERRAAYLTNDVDTLIVAPNILELETRAVSSGNTMGLLADVDFEALRQWVRRGGHLVWISDGTSSIGTLGMPSVSREGPTTDAAVPLVPSPLSAGVERVDGKSTLRVAFNAPARAAPIIGDDTGAVVASYPFGKGRITIVTDQTLFANSRLAKASNARLAYNVAAAGMAAHGTVAFDEWVHGYLSGDSWWTILPAPIRVALLLTGAALLLLVIGTALRFGPTAQPPQDVERTSAEYVASMAALLERGRAASKAVRDLVDTCVRDIARSVGLPDSSPISAIRAQLKDDGAGGEALIELDRLRSYERPTPAELVRAAQLTLHLRKEYTRYGRIGFIRRGAPAQRST